jgi:IMP dehydrogenase/GMP reductase
MIKQNKTGLNSRSEANPYDENGMLPLLTAPMYSLVDGTNFQIFLDNKVQVCLPRKVKCNMSSSQGFYSYSLDEFKEFTKWKDDNVTEHICIDTANGNMPALYQAIKEAKEIHGDKLIIMSGNVSSLDAFIELARSGCDYIRVGIGGSSGCNTTSNTGVGQKDLRKLIKKCYNERDEYITFARSIQERRDGQVQGVFGGWTEEELARINVSKVKIVADGITSYVNKCIEKYNFNSNAYAAINNLLYAGADLVMIGKLFAQCEESAGEKRYQVTYKDPVDDSSDGFRMMVFDVTRERVEEIKKIDPDCEVKMTDVKYSGMSTLAEQVKYKKKSPGYTLKPSEGSLSWRCIKWTLPDWIKGNAKQDEYPYLMGYENSLVSAMSYAGAKTLAEFKNI